MLACPLPRAAAAEVRAHLRPAAPQPLQIQLQRRRHADLRWQALGWVVGLGWAGYVGVGGSESVHGAVGRGTRAVQRSVERSTAQCSQHSGRLQHSPAQPRAPGRGARPASWAASSPHSSAASGPAGRAGRRPGACAWWPGEGGWGWGWGGWRRGEGELGEQAADGWGPLPPRHARGSCRLLPNRLGPHALPYAAHRHQLASRRRAVVLHQRVGGPAGQAGVKGHARHHALLLLVLRQRRGVRWRQAWGGRHEWRVQGSTAHEAGPSCM